jgi:hypothetical protein
MQKKSFRALSIVTVLLTLLGLLGLESSHLPWHNGLSNLEVTQRMGGNVALTEAQLTDVVKRKKLIAYWVGPISGYRYSIEARRSGQVFIRYLPVGVSAQSSSPSFSIIATYLIDNAFDNIQTAAHKSGAFGVLTSDGAAVYYKISQPTNVYVAYKNSNIEFEIYNPDPNIAFGTAVFAKNFIPVS